MLMQQQASLSKSADVAVPSSDIGVQKDSASVEPSADDTESKLHEDVDVSAEVPAAGENDPPSNCVPSPSPSDCELSLSPSSDCVPSPFPLRLCAVYLPLQLRTISISLYSTAYLTDGGKETADDDADEEDNLDEVETYLEYLNLLKLAEDKLEMELDAYRQLEKDLEHTELEKLRVASPKPAREIRRKRSLNSSECCNTEKNLVFIALNLNYHDSVSTSIIL